MSKRSSNDLTPSLFDEPIEQQQAAVVTDDIGNTNDELDDWEEVPQARFLSWSTTMQLHYCWRRDLDAATRADSTSDARFFLERAASYKQEMDTDPRD